MSGDGLDETTLVLPCLDEGPSLRALLPRVPADLRVVVADNASTDDTAAVARSFGATVVQASPRGYGAAVHAGVEAATTRWVAVMDGDGSLDPDDVAPLLALVRGGEADLAMGRRVPVSRGLVPWHARLGNAMILRLLRRRIGVGVRDIGPLRVCERERLLALGVEDRGMGYPVELLDRATRAGWRIVERDVAYHPRTAGTRSKVSGSLRGTLRTARDIGRVLA
ncbi:glycosyltransferase family 2 protein [Nocardioides sp. TRM66260-LWL]|uniref:glycosyltransferase family 2 protein n=1 Tax=Nocardioides sp. TRM66260-LWL TaxID=2874478 RepID=UPI0021E14F6D|nr:glycosyltransferase family 2 protein [Nocardioides sp. TRM66260-LWL]